MQRLLQFIRYRNQPKTLLNTLLVTNTRNTRKTSILPCFGAILLTVFSSLSMNANAQVYGGFIAGKAEPYNNGDIADSRFPPIEGATGYKVSLGNALSPVFAYEFSYVDLGDYIVGDAEGAVVDPNEQSDQISVSGIDVSVVGNFAMTRKLALYTKLGLMYWLGERAIEREDPATAATTIDTTEYNEKDISTGVGLRFDFTRTIRFNIEANAYKTDDVYNLLYGAGFFITF